MISTDSEAVLLTLRCNCRFHSPGHGGNCGSNAQVFEQKSPDLQTSCSTLPLPVGNQRVMTQFTNIHTLFVDVMCFSTHSGLLWEKFASTCPCHFSLALAKLIVPGEGLVDKISVAEVKGGLQVLARM